MNQKALIAIMITISLMTTSCIGKEYIIRPQTTTTTEQVCNEEGNYCHLYRQNGGVINITFPESTGILEYRVET